MEEILFSAGLVVIGFVLLAVEIFVVPGFGVVGVAGGGLVMGGVFLTWARLGMPAGLATLAISVAVTAGGFWFLGRSKAGGRMVLKDEVRGDSVDRVGMQSFVGRQGVAETDLRPSGTAGFDEERHHVMTDGEYITRGTPVLVVRVSTNTLVVVRADGDEGTKNE